MAAKTTQVGFQLKGMKELLKVLGSLPKEYQGMVRDASQAIATDLASSATGAAHTDLQRLAAQGLKVKRDRVPVLRGGVGMTPGGAEQRDVFFGAEFGGGRRATTRQFPTHRGRDGYFLYPTARAKGEHYAQMWVEAVDKAFQAWDHRER